MSAEVLDTGVRGAFLTVEDTARAVNALEEEGFTPEDITVFSPIPTPHLEERLTRRTSPVRWFTLIGGLLGTCTGLALTLWTFHAWPLQVGGKSTSSLPVAVVIMFELTVLLGGLFTLAAVLIFSRLPTLGRNPGYHPRFSDDLFGVYVHTADDDARSRARRVLDGVGALEVEHATA
ncbi:MAG TPA: DUF3341 domain-containing protein [Gemmatimonadota bacterium]|nr:DUF3341 domain-containing protein [Gemmatimonadota bacterium]